MKSFIKKLFSKKVPAPIEKTFTSAYRHHVSEVGPRVSALLSEITTLSSTMITLYETSVKDATADEAEAFSKARIAVATLLKKTAEDGENVVSVASDRTWFYISDKTGERI